MKNNVPFDIFCGECHGKIRVQTVKYKNKKYIYLWCKNCKKRLKGGFVKNFLGEKYAERIRCMEITNAYSAKIFF